MLKVRHSHGVKLNKETSKSLGSPNIGSQLPGDTLEFHNSQLRALEIISRLETQGDEKEPRVPGHGGYHWSATGQGAVSMVSVESSPSTPAAAAAWGPPARTFPWPALSLPGVSAPMHLFRGVFHDHSICPIQKKKLLD